MVPNTEHESAPKIAMYSIRAFYLSVMTVNILKIENACMLYILHTFLKIKYIHFLLRDKTLNLMKKSLSDDLANKLLHCTYYKE